MALVICNAGELLLLDNALGDSTPENLILKLYSNDYTPVAASVAGNFTEVVNTGYSAATLTAATWAAAATNGSGDGEKAYATQTFTMTNNTDPLIYGCYFVGATSGTLYFAERFTNPIAIPAAGLSVQVTPTITLASGA